MQTRIFRNFWVANLVQWNVLIIGKKPINSLCFEDYELLDYKNLDEENFAYLAQIFDENFPSQ